MKDALHTGVHPFFMVSYPSKAQHEWQAVAVTLAQLGRNEVRKAADFLVSSPTLSTN